ncbi:4'-phosphopantetheinyl transferase [uncultured Tateyamaria sp.]|uniref:4'-phosphopantetheinyl transferase family protein n=1 Tax=uncultured Tateyamaria sp. TaxID=455651 RepID=UPI00263A10F0|nr:4'-phosphopantetheinyl transferase superfamily protein [uncultured Tateyamaria sp.]
MTHFEVLRQQVQVHLSRGVGVGVANPRASATGLYPAEETATLRMVDKRLREFCAGRLAARQAMEAIDLPLAPVPMGPDRSPCWPEGVLGSITHCECAALAVTARADTVRALGIDLEEAEPLERDLWDTVLTTAERERTSDGLTAKYIFCAKEAVYKAQFPMTGQQLGFDDVEVTLQGAQFTASIPDAKGTWSGVISNASVLSRNLIISIVTLH